MQNFFIYFAYTNFIHCENIYKSLRIFKIKSIYCTILKLHNIMDFGYRVKRGKLDEQ